MARSGPVTKNTSTVALGLAQIRVGSSSDHIADVTPALTATQSIGALANTKFSGNVDFWKLESGFPLLEDLTLPIRESALLECSFKEITPYNLALARGIDPAGGISATVVELDRKTAAGATVGDIVVADDDGPVNDTWTVVINAAADGYAVYGQDAGHVGDSLSNALFEPAHGVGEYFSIPANFFDASWVADETLTFRTTAYHAAGNYDDAHAGTINLGALSAPDFVRMEAVYTYPDGAHHMYVIFPRANVVSSIELDWQTEDAAASPLSFEGKRADEEIAGGNPNWNSSPIGRIIFD